MVRTHISLVYQKKVNDNFSLAAYHDQISKQGGKHMKEIKKYWKYL